MALSQQYISDELTHFVGRGRQVEDQFDLLCTILGGGVLHRPQTVNDFLKPINPKPVGTLSDDVLYNRDIVCFCDIPFDDLHIHATKYSYFGLAFKKPFLVSQGATPVFYVAADATVYDEFFSGEPDFSKANSSAEVAKIAHEANEKIQEDATLSMQDGKATVYPEVRREDHLRKVYDRLLNVFSPGQVARLLNQDQPAENASEYDNAKRQFLSLEQVLKFDFFSFIKIFDSSLSEHDPNNFYMEREWRVRDRVKFQFKDVERLIVPKQFFERLGKVFPGSESKICSLPPK